MTETLQRDAAQVAVTADRAGAERRPPADKQSQIAQMQELAAMAKNQDNERGLFKAQGLEPESYFREKDDRIARNYRYTRGEIHYDTSLEIPLGMLESAGRVTDLPEIRGLRDEYFASMNDPVFGAMQFECGQIRYTLKQPFTLPRLRGAGEAMKLAPNASRDQIERQIHVHFQFLFREPPDEWTEQEQQEWNTILSYIDFEAYQSDNPAPENRIGRLVEVNADKVVIRWNTAGEQPHDTRDVPPEVLTATPGWLVHAEFRKRNGREQWASARVEPPIESEEKVMAEDMERAARSLPSDLLPADWPKAQD